VPRAAIFSVSLGRALPSGKRSMQVLEGGAVDVDVGDPLAAGAPAAGELGGAEATPPLASCAFAATAQSRATELAHAAFEIIGGLSALGA
jgi:hypothetical protein